MGPDQMQQMQSPKVDGNGLQLQVGDAVQLRGKSQYMGSVMTVESIDVGDGRVRVAMQKPDGTTSRMAFDPSHIEKVGGVTVVQQPQIVQAEPVAAMPVQQFVESQQQFVQQTVV